MKIGIFSVYDSKAEAYLPPFYAHNAAVARRTMEQAVTDPNHNFRRYAEDYTLFEVGQFDDSTGNFIDLQPKKSLGNALHIKAQADQAMLTTDGIQSITKDIRDQRLSSEKENHGN